jgi:hypothetical protein
MNHPVRRPQTADPFWSPIGFGACRGCLPIVWDRCHLGRHLFTDDCQNSISHVRRPAFEHTWIVGDAIFDRITHNAHRLQ